MGMKIPLQCQYQMDVFPSPKSVGDLSEQCLHVTPAGTISRATFPISLHFRKAPSLGIMT